MIIDAAFNVTDKAFDRDRDAVIERCRANGVFPILVGVDVKSSAECIEYAEKYGLVCYAGIHPTSSNTDVESLCALLISERVVALGECGLDFDRLSFRGKEEQVAVFTKQLELRSNTYFLHSRNCHREFLEIISDYSFAGVVHSFTGEIEDAKDYIKRGLFVGINGCSLKTQEQMDIVREIPIESMIVETDAPYCKIRRSSPAYALAKTTPEEKGLLKRNEPVCVWQVADVVAGVKSIDAEVAAATLNKNARVLFGGTIDAAIETFFTQRA